jgi:glycosyltransferase involved in cell wall biosynthesis
MCPLVHYLRYGISENRFPTPQAERAILVRTDDSHLVSALKKIVKISYPAFAEMSDAFINKYIVLMFSPEYYRETTKSASNLTDIDLLLHYIVHGLPNGLPPGPLFDEEYYRQQLDRMEIRHAADFLPFQHWLQHGQPRHVSPTPLFSQAVYQARNPDLVEYHGWLFDHFLETGVNEGRQFLKLIEIGANVLSERPRLAPSATSEFIKALSSVENGFKTKHVVQRMEDFWNSDVASDIFAAANVLEPDIGGMERYTQSLAPPWHDGSYTTFRTFRDLIPSGKFDDIVFVPFCKLGGADFVAGVLAKSLTAQGRRVLILRTEQSDWARPDWFPREAETFDLSIYLNRMPEADALRALYTIVKDSKAKNIYNVNSYRCFKLLEKFGRQIKLFTKAHVYYFCADRDANGFEVGYPVWFFSNILNDISSAIFDTEDLRSTLCARYGLSRQLVAKTHTIYTPAMTEPAEVSVAVRQVETRSSREKPVLIWAGRLDRQKRFDLVISIAKKMPEVEFQCWGKAVLDAPPDMTSLPENVHLNGTFDSFEELPLEDSDGWLYTSQWDGLPTILIECAALGMPIVASAVGGVPELVTPETGWLVQEADDVSAYVEAIKDMLSNDHNRIERANNARELVRKRHRMPVYMAKIAQIGGE